MIPRVVFLVLAGLAVGDFFGGGPALAFQGCLRGACHQDLTKAKYLHGPVAAEMAGARACEICHQPAGPACTAAKGGIFKLKGKGLCLTCHDKGASTRHTQEQIESRCLACHDPHGSEISPQLLRVNRQK